MKARNNRKKNVVPSNLLFEALKIVILKKTWIFGSYKPETWNYRKTNNDVEGFNRILNKYLNSPHPNIFKFVDHLMLIWFQMY